MRYVRASRILAVFDVLANLNTWLKCIRPDSESTKPSQEASRPCVIIVLTSRELGVLPEHAKSAGTTSLAVSRPAIVQGPSAGHHAVLGSASLFAQLVTNSPTMAILGAFPQSVGRTSFICSTALHLW